jgi:RsiW-degrading membrane proteinase PrsW (M82 family)
LEGTLFWRGALSPLGGYGIWTAMVGAALWRVKGTRPFELKMLQDAKFLRVFFVAVGLHTIWNSPLELPIFGSWGKLIILGFVAWVVVLSLVQMGLKEIREAQSKEGDSVNQKEPTGTPLVAPTPP